MLPLCLLGTLLTPVAAASWLLAAGCQPEQRPGSVRNASEAHLREAFPPASRVFSGPVPGAFATPTSVVALRLLSGPTPGDGVYTPVSNVDGYQYFAVDFQDISALTNAVNEGIPLPSSHILASTSAARTSGRLRASPRASRFRARRGSRQGIPRRGGVLRQGTFLDAPVVQAIAGVGSAAGYSPSSAPEAIQKGVQRILYYHVLQELSAALPKIEAGNVEPVAGAPHNVDEAWAIYMGLPDGTSFRDLFPLRRAAGR